MNFIELIKGFWGKYKSQIILGLALVISLLFLFRACANQIDSRKI